MKPSHLTTPRTMADGCWIASADPLDFPHQRRPSWTAVDFVIAAMFVGVVASISMGVL